MKIAFIHTDNVFTTTLLSELQAKLSQHEILPWLKGDGAPAFDFDVVLVMGELNRDQMQAQAKLQLIQTTTAGYEGIDVEAASELGIWVSFCPSDITGNAVSVAEFAVLLMIGASRQLNQALRSMQDSSVEAPRLNPALSGKTVCIVGLGGIGSLLLDRLRPFGMRMLATAHHPENAPADVEVFPSDQIDVALGQSDYVVLCVPASPENQDMINAETLAAMKQGATLINIGRGMLVDEKALYNAVKSGQIAAAGLDVTKTESTEKKNPLLELPQVLITPHIAGETDLMLHGTVAYIKQVMKQFGEGKRSESFLNAPPRPRKALDEDAWTYVTWFGSVLRKGNAEVQSHVVRTPVVQDRVSQLANFAHQMAELVSAFIWSCTNKVAGRLGWWLLIFLHRSSFTNAFFDCAILSDSGRSSFRRCH